MGRTLDAIRKAEKDRLIKQAEMRVFEMEESLATGQREQTSMDEPGPCSLVPERTTQEYNRLKQGIINLIPRSPRAILLASATGDEGNSRVVANFGITIASAGERTLLVDADQRNPSLHEILVARKGSGLHELLSGREKLKQVLQQTNFPKLSFVPAGGGPPNAFSLFASGTIDYVIEQMKVEADWVIFDSPAVNMFDDAVCLGARTDGVVLVIRAGKTRWEIAENACQYLEGGNAKILGVVLNERTFHIPAWIYRKL